MAYKFQSGEAILSGALKQEGTISGSGDVTLAVGKDFNIAGSNVLNLTTLGSSVVGSSLTSVGTLTGLTASSPVAANGGLEAGYVTSHGDISGSADLTLGVAIDIDGSQVLSKATLGSTVLASSLTSVGTLSSLAVGNVTSTGIVSASGDLRLGAGAGIDIGGQANVLSQATLGSTVLASSLTSVGTLSSLAVGNVTSTGILSASGDLTLGAGKGIDIGGATNVLQVASLGSTVLASSLTSVGTLSSLAVGNVTSTGILSASGDLTLGAGKGIDIGGAANVLQAATLGSTVLASSLTSVGTLVGVTSSQPIVASAGIRGGSATFDGSISGSGRITLDGDRSIRFANVDALSATTLGSQVLASSLTSVGTLAGVTSSAPIVAAAGLRVSGGVISGSTGISGSSAKFSGIVNAGRFVGNGGGITGITADLVDVTASAADVSYELAFVETLGTGKDLGGNLGLSFNPRGLLSQVSSSLLLSGSNGGFQQSRLAFGNGAAGGGTQGFMSISEDSGYVFNMKAADAQILISGSTEQGVMLMSGDAAQAGVMIHGAQGLKGMNAAMNGTNWSISQAGIISASSDLRLGAGAGIDIGGQANVLSQATLGSTVLASSLTSVGTLAGVTSSMPVVSLAGFKGGSVISTGLSSSGRVTLDDDRSIRFGGVDTLKADTLGARVLASSLTSVGTLSSLAVGNVTSTGILSASGDLHLGAGAGIDIGGQANVLSQATLGSTVLASSLTSVGTLAGLTASSPIAANGGLITTDISHSSGDLIVRLHDAAANNVAFRLAAGTFPLKVLSTGVVELNGGEVKVGSSAGAISGSGVLQAAGAASFNSTLSVNGAITLAGASEVAVAVGSDSIYIRDADGTMKRDTIVDLVAGIAGTGLSAASGQLSLSSVGTVTAVGDANASLTEGLTYGSTTLTANRTWTLPASSGLAAGDVLRIKAPADVGAFYIKVTGSGGLQSIDAGDAELYIESDAGAIALHYVATDKFVIF